MNLPRVFLPNWREKPNQFTMKGRAMWATMLWHSTPGIWPCTAMIGGARSTNSTRAMQKAKVNKLHGSCTTTTRLMFWGRLFGTECQVDLTKSSWWDGFMFMMMIACQNQSGRTFLVKWGKSYPWHQKRPSTLRNLQLISRFYSSGPKMRFLASSREVWCWVFDHRINYFLLTHWFES